MSGDILKFALAYAARGWPVIPLHSIRDGRCTCGKADCSSPGKHPRTPHGLKDASTDPGVITAWFKHQWPGDNIGIVTGDESKLVALDVDPRHGGDQSLAELQEQIGPLPRTPVALTGGGGQHLLFQHPGNRTVIRNVTTLAGLSGLDVRGDGGYIVVAPSNHTSGGVYRWDSEAMPSKTPLAPIPPALLELLVSRNGNQHEPAAGDGEPIPDGQRNAVLTSLAGTMRKRGMGEEAIAAALLAENAARCRPPLTDNEVSAIARSVGRYDPGEIPTGRLWSFSSLKSSSEEKWPDPPDPAAYYGLAGDMVRATAPHTEADPVALLVQTLVAFGNIIGRGPHFIAEADRHAMNFFSVLVGRTSKGRKGSSWSRVRQLFQAADLTWVDNNIKPGLSSGEGLIWAVRDPIEKESPVKEKGRIVEYQTEMVDQGVDDKRLLVLEPEFANVLRVLGREHNTLSAIIRQAWDSGNLRTLVKNNPAQATDAHISIIGHVTKDELLRYLDSTEAGNGFANRFLWLCIRRSKVLPFGGGDAHIWPLVIRLRQAIEFGRGVREIGMDEQARAIWEAVYEKLTEEVPGMLGAVTSRAEAQVRRLACVYALLDLSTVVRQEHLKAALALWGYCEASAGYIFGDALGDPVADAILRALRSAPDGLTRTEIRDLFGRNRSAGEIERGFGILLCRGLVRAEKIQTGGKPTEKWFAMRMGYDINDQNDQSPPS